MLRAQSAGICDWMMWRRTYDAWGYSPLEQINKNNVKVSAGRLTWSMTNGATETTPIVHDRRAYSVQLRQQDPGAQRRNGEPELGIPSAIWAGEIVSAWRQSVLAQYGDL